MHQPIGAVPDSVTSRRGSTQQQSRSQGPGSHRSPTHRGRAGIAATQSQRTAGSAAQRRSQAPGASQTSQAASQRSSGAAPRTRARLQPSAEVRNELGQIAGDGIRFHTHDAYLNAGSEPVPEAPAPPPVEPTSSPAATVRALEPELLDILSRRRLPAAAAAYRELRVVPETPMDDRCELPPGSAAQTAPVFTPCSTCGDATVPAAQPAPSSQAAGSHSGAHATHDSTNNVTTAAVAAQPTAQPTAYPALVDPWKILCPPPAAADSQPQVPHAAAPLAADGPQPVPAASGNVADEVIDMLSDSDDDVVALAAVDPVAASSLQGAVPHTGPTQECPLQAGVVLAQGAEAMAERSQQNDAQLQDDPGMVQQQQVDALSGAAGPSGAHEAGSQGAGSGVAHGSADGDEVYVSPTPRRRRKRRHDADDPFA